MREFIGILIGVGTGEEKPDFRYNKGIRWSLV
jgi:hypothetical protein